MRVEISIDTGEKSPTDKEMFFIREVLRLAEVKPDPILEVTDPEMVSNFINRAGLSPEVVREMYGDVKPSDMPQHRES